MELLDLGSETLSTFAHAASSIAVVINIRNIIISTITITICVVSIAGIIVTSRSLVGQFVIMLTMVLTTA